MIYYLYKTTNIINNKIYIGVHQTENIEDGYMGSGKHLKRALKKYGLQSFVKEILRFFETKEEMYITEAEIVNEEFVKRKDTYNIKYGGLGGCKGFVVVKDKANNVFSVSVNDPQYLSGELVGLTKGFVTVKDKNGNTFCVNVNDPRYLSGELIHNTKGLVVVKNKDGNIFSVKKDDPRYLSGELKHVAKGLIPVKDKDGNTFSVKKDDPRYLSGELKHTSKGQKHTEETKQKRSFTLKERGFMWICNLELNQNKFISKDKAIPEGWQKGKLRKNKNN